jgi:flagellar operon protein
MNGRINAMNSDIRLRRANITGTAGQVSGSKPASAGQPSAKAARSFEEVLGRASSPKAGEVKFSKHAIDRLKSRNIELSESELRKIDEAFSKARQKGIKDALILMNEKAFIGNIKNNTVITASVKDDLNESVFTNIDGAIIVR